MSSRDDWLPRPIEERLTSVAAAFLERFGRAPKAIAQAPGRVNLIGEHLDYNGGLVLPVAIDRSVLVAFASRDDAEVHAYSTDFGQESSFRLGSQIQKSDEMPWSNCVRGVCSVLTEACTTPAGVELAIAGDVPIGAGLSSSAALEVATAGALRAAWELDLDDKRLALACQRAENEFVGVECGVMDQLASALGCTDHALLIDCRSLEWEHVPLLLTDNDLALVVVDSGQRRRLEQSDYNRRREECGEALAFLRAGTADRPQVALRDVVLDDLESCSLPETLLQRARHVVTEQRRVECAVEALRSSDFDRFGALMNETHASLRDDFDVSTPELDRLAELAQRQCGVLGARLTGAGFGGCTVNLVRRDAVDSFAIDIVERYANETKLPTRMLVCRAADGLRVHRLG